MNTGDIQDMVEAATNNNPDGGEKDISDDELLDLALDLEERIVQRHDTVVSGENVVQHANFALSVPGMMNVPWPAWTFNNCNVTVNMSK